MVLKTQKSLNLEVQNADLGHLTYNHKEVKQNE